jgi:hypothetical protein
VTPFAWSEADDELALWTPDLRLRFRRVGDRWTHALDLAPGPWQTVADAVEWSEADPESVLGPVYQEVHLHHDATGPAILAVGRVGAHHVSASFRLEYRSWRALHPFRVNPDDPLARHSRNLERHLHSLQDRSVSRVSIDVADRCRAASAGLEARYAVRQPPVCMFLGVDADFDHPARWTPDWRESIAWETRLAGSYDVTLETPPGSVGSRLSILDRPGGKDWLVRAATLAPPSGETSRFAYTWSHARVKAFDEREVPGPVRAWQLEGAIPPADLTPHGTRPQA